MTASGEIVSNEVIPKYLEMRLLAGQTVESIAIYQAGGQSPSSELIERFGEMIWPDKPTPEKVMDAMRVFGVDSLADVEQVMNPLKSAVDSVSNSRVISSKVSEQILSVAESYRRYATSQRARSFGAFLTSVS